MPQLIVAIGRPRLGPHRDGTERARVVTRRTGGGIIEMPAARPDGHRVSVGSAPARAMEEAGMQRAGRLARDVVHPNMCDEPRDVLVYAATR
jgi:hypothetical protein